MNYNLQLIVESIRSLSCPEDVEYYQSSLNIVFSFLSYLIVLIFWVLFWCISLCWLGFSHWLLSRLATSSIRASQVRRGIIWWFQGNQLLFGGDRVSISERRWDYLWDRVSISKQRVDCSRNQFEGVDSFGNSSRVSHGGKDPVFI